MVTATISRLDGTGSSRTSMTLNAVVMPSNSTRHLELYRNDWQQFVTSNSNNGVADNPLHELRNTGWQEFERIGFPIHRRGNELWKYTDLRQIDRSEFRFGAPSALLDRDALIQRVPLSDAWHNVVFVDGVLDEVLSDDRDAPVGVELKSVANFGHLGKLADCADNAFVALNSAFAGEGIFIEVVADAEGSKPIHLVFATTGAESCLRAVYPRFALSVDRGGAATVIESHVAMSDATHLSAPVSEISLADDATLKHYRVQIDGESSYHFSTTRVLQEASSDYRSTSFSIGSDIGRNDVFTHLVGEYAESTLHGVYLTTNRQHQDNEISTTHTAPNCTSDQYYKGILSGRSRAVFSGKITVERGAQKTDANQKDLNLLLSHGAEVDTKPSLEIYADDVKCAHGATAGHVDEDTLFYLQSRGVDYDTAQAMLIRGFAAEILSEFEDDDLHAFLENQLDALMPDLQAASDTIGTA